MVCAKSVHGLYMVAVLTEMADAGQRAAADKREGNDADAGRDMGGSQPSGRNAGTPQARPDGRAVQKEQPSQSLTCELPPTGPMLPPP